MFRPQVLALCVAFCVFPLVAGAQATNPNGENAEPDPNAGESKPRVTVQSGPGSSSQPTEQTAPPPTEDEPLFEPAALPADGLGISGPQKPATAETPAAAESPTDAPPKTDENLPSVEDLQAAVDQMAESGLPAEQKDAVLVALKEALESLKRLKALAADRIRFEQDTKLAVERATALQTQLDELRKRPEPSLPNTLAEMEAEAARRTAALATLKTELAELQSTRSRVSEQKAEIQKVKAEADRRRADLKKKIDLPGSPDDTEELTKAVRLRARIQLARLEQQLQTAEYELAKFAAEDSAHLLDIQETLKRATLDRETAFLKKLNDAISAEEQRQANLRIQEARRAALFADDRFQGIAKVNELLARRNQQTNLELNELEAELADRKAQLSEVEDSFDDAVNRVETVGDLTQPIGLLLRRNRAELPSVARLRDSLGSREEPMAQARLEELDIADESENTPSVDDLLGPVPEDEPLSEEQAALRADADRLLQMRSEFLRDAKNNQAKKFQLLSDLYTQESSLIQKTNEYLEYIDTRVLWIRSSDPLSISALKDDRSSVEMLTDSGNWGDAFRTVFNAFRFNVIWALIAVATVVALIGLRMHARATIRACGKLASKPGNRDFTPTLRAGIYTALSAVPGPLILISVAVFLQQSNSPFNDALASALRSTARLWFPIELIYLVCRTGGLAEAHFKWPLDLVRSLRRTLTTARLVLLPLNFVWAVLAAFDPLGTGLEAGPDALFLPDPGTTAAAIASDNPQTSGVIDQSDELNSESILMFGRSQVSTHGWERVVFIALLTAFAIFAHRIFRLSGRTHTSMAKEGTVPSSIVVWWTSRAAAVLLPVVLIVLTASGYHFTATQIYSAFLWSVWLLAGLFTLTAFLFRGVTLLRRRAKFERWQQQRELREHETASVPHPAGEAASLPQPPDDESVDFDKTSDQTRKLIVAIVCGVGLFGFWSIWNEILPAVRIVENWPLYSVSRMVTVEALDPGADTAMTTTEEQQVPITILHWAAGLLIAVFAFMASRNLPGFLEIAVLGNLPIDAASRYAITRIVAYLSLILGILAFTSTIGLAWSQVQWLAAGLTVGLGFGLQEVFANFVSGLIILFERPVRVGDIVTVEGVTGIVTRIRIRATTIVNWDRQEFIVPNKEFITGRLLNWTLNDTTNRILINVGIAYGSDTELARSILKQTCAEHPDVLEDPKPLVTMEGFGASSLDFVVRAYLANMDNRLETIHQMHVNIDMAFRKAGIEIAFPQQDIHLRDVPSDWLGGPRANGSSETKMNVADSNSGNSNGSETDRDPKISQSV
ncbi:mechanosensitive ion channel domain-containing protein [Stratiformator vulcanicus]|uniref:Mechanosensitive channel MscK n=1 Tax=Stratiformator vulcanicus TaxID=2527980 RepID=A0A517R3B1_9PLAN|nr:mechanosensitive ion channel domain-containing protein [Stratiformator vulcanicus]QDT38351.1 Mechanosensitive channel MscK precursor [Stratiformator vulcanicus]